MEERILWLASLVMFITRGGESVDNPADELFLLWSGQALKQRYLGNIEMREVLQEGFNLILHTEVFQILHSLSLLASARSRCMTELLGSGDTFFFSAKGGFISLTLCPNG